MSVVELSEIAAELRDVLATIDTLVVEVHGTKDNPLLGAVPRWQKALLEAKAQSTIQHPERTIPEHKTFAELAVFQQWAEQNAAKHGLSAAQDRAHSLRQLLSAMQTGTKVEADFTRTAPESSFGARRSA